MKVKKLVSLVLMLCIVSAFTCVGPTNVAFAANSAITNGVQWNNTAGNPINAYGGSIIKDGSTYYWVGTEYDPSVAPKKTDYVATNLYSSTDLVNWTFRKAILTRTSHPDLENGTDITWCSRPAIFYSSYSKKWVLINEWQDVNTMALGNNEIGWATCSTIDGDYTWQGHYLPDGYAFHDMSMYSENGKNYFTTSNWDGPNGADCAIWEMGSDDKVSTRIKTFDISGQIEGTHLFKRNNYYYWIGSEKVGWRGSVPKYTKATTIAGLGSSPYTSISCSGTDADTGFKAQCDFVLPIVSSSGTTYMYCGDRWSIFYPSYAPGNQIWLPMTWSGDTPSLTWTSSWKPVTK